MNENEKKSGEAETKKGVSAKLPSEGGRIRKAISSMSMEELFDYALYNVLIPSGKRAIQDILDKFFNSSPSSSSSASSSSAKIADRTSYSSASAANSAAQNVAPPSISTRNVYSYESLRFATRQDAVRALEYLQDTLGRYNIVRVAALMEFCEIQPSTIEYKYGWTNLDGAEVYSIPNSTEHGLRLPRAKQFQ